MGDKSQFAKEFYCENCGSMTAVIIANLGVVRCIGCDARYKYNKHAVWQLSAGKTDVRLIEELPILGL